MRFLDISTAIGLCLPHPQSAREGFVPARALARSAFLPSGTNVGTRRSVRPSPPHRHHHRHRHRTAVSMMGLMDFLGSKFADSREGDFIRLDEGDTDDFGPGPLIVLYAFPGAIDDEELRDMVDDGMPSRSGAVTLRRVLADDDDLLDMTVSEALSTVAGGGAMTMAMTTAGSISIRPPEQYDASQPCPVLYFSGVSNEEMMATYRIIADEIYAETEGRHWPACAKAVPPAMSKSMRRVLEEISGDHADAMNMKREEAESGGAGD